MIRLFTGLGLPPDIVTMLSDLRGGVPGARWIEPEDYHLTLQFVGNVEEDVGQELHELLTRLRKPPVEVILERLDVFGGSKPRAIVLAARQTPSLIDLHGSHERILKQLGIPVESRKYLPHVTLARLKGVEPASVAQYADARGYFRPRSFIADEFNLYSSPRSGGGGPYRIEADYSLRA